MTSAPTDTNQAQGPAGLFRRLAAISYDSLLLMAILFAATTILLPFTDGEAISSPWYTLYLLLLSYLYFAWFWLHGGQTLGMAAWNLRLRARRGYTFGWQETAIRFAAALVSWLALGLGFVWILFDREQLAWHDRLSHTELLRE